MKERASGAPDGPPDIILDRTFDAPAFGLLADPLKIDRRVADCIGEANAEIPEVEARSGDAHTIIREAQPWPPLHLPGPQTRPAFPIHTLQSWLRDYVEALAEEHQVALDGPAMTSLASLGGAGAKRFEVYAGGNEGHPTNLWAFVVMPSSEGKSPYIRPMHELWLRAEERLQDVAKKLKRTTQLERAILTRKKSDLIGACARAQVQADAERFRAEAADIDERLNALEDRPLPRLITEDTTMEALARVMSQNRGAITVMSDEGTTLFTNASRTAPGGMEAIELLLKAHSGDTFTRDRITTGLLTVHKPALTVIISTQATTFARLVRRESFRGRGLWGRFLLIFPPSRVGERRGQGSPVRLQLSTSYGGAIQKLLAFPVVERGDGRVRLNLNEEAQAMWVSFCKEIDRRMGTGGDLSSESIRAWAGKIRTNVLRVAACLLLAEFIAPLDADEPVVLDGGVLGRAIAIMRYCLAHAQSVMMEHAQLPADAETVLDWLRERDTTIFRARELQRARQRMFPERKLLQPALDELVKLGVIRRVPGSGGIGCPPEEYEVHPALVKGR